MSHRFGWGRPLVWFIAGLAAAGCGDDRVGVAVSGKVTVNGQPMGDIGVTFEPVGGGAGRGSYGKTDAQGQYALRFVDTDGRGALPGKHQVSFTDLQNQPTESPDAGAAPPLKSRLPPSVAGTRLDFEVPAGGTSSADFDLK
jgi:hypothetical protein